MKKLILASASSRRKQLLELTGLIFEVEPSSIEETLISGLSPHELTKELSIKKAQAVARNHHNALVIAADTIIVIENKIIGKPRTEAEARNILITIRGKCHSVVTGFSIVDTNINKVASGSVETKVFIKELTLEEIDAYVQSGEPIDKAGAYAIQGLGSVIVDRIEGDYYNVVGLPISTLAQSLKQFDIYILAR